MNNQEKEFVTFEIATQMEALGYKINRDEQFGRFTLEGN